MMWRLLAILEETNYILSQTAQVSTWEIASVLISGAALIFAIFIPSRIANRQDKIALFEKRFAAYSDLLKLKSFADILRDDRYSFDPKVIEATGEILSTEMFRRASLVSLHFGTIFNYLPIKLGSPETVQATVSTIKSIEISVNTLPLLYGKNLDNNGEDASQEVASIFECLFSLMAEITLQNQEINDKNRTNFIAQTDAFIEKYTDIFEKSLRL